MRRDRRRQRKMKRFDVITRTPSLDADSRRIASRPPIDPIQKRDSHDARSFKNINQYDVTSILLQSYFISL